MVTVVSGIVSLFPHLLGSRSPLVPLRRQLGVKNETSSNCKEVCLLDNLKLTCFNPPAPLLTIHMSCTRSFCFLLAFSPPPPPHTHTHTLPFCFFDDNNLKVHFTTVNVYVTVFLFICNLRKHIASVFPALCCLLNLWLRCMNKLCLNQTTKTEGSTSDLSTLRKVQSISDMSTQRKIQVHTCPQYSVNCGSGSSSFKCESCVYGCRPLVPGGG